MMLPEALNATLDPRKITHYLLVPDHPDNGGKAKFFMACGFDPGRPEELRHALLAHPVVNKVEGVKVSWAGRKFVVECHLATPDGQRHCIRTIWIDDGEGPPRFVTAYPHL